MFTRGITNDMERIFIMLSENMDYSIFSRLLPMYCTVDVKRAFIYLGSWRFFNLHTQHLNAHDTTKGSNVSENFLQLITQS
jgi:hypothetical protein